MNSHVSSTVLFLIIKHIQNSSGEFLDNTLDTVGKKNRMNRIVDEKKGGDK
jgi:hypothetical protein